ncbi:Ran GTPase-activating protein 1-like [Homarus americanus]|uniref:Ran GTPase-activating protein 1-like n=1 Tax=Homarus americanus TaxID=6706 RepID=A0A8J5K3N7_HOMAM|nr:Ran GTPase-activating protein 1-like [Homarus americanus]
MEGRLSFAGLSNKWDTAQDVKEAAEAIRNCKDLRCLKLEANTLGVEAAKVMGDALAVHPEFERAHWKDLFTGRLKTEIPDALVSDNNSFKGAKLKELDLSDNALGPVGVEGMVEFMSSPVCYSLELSNTYVLPQEIRLNNNGLGIKGGTMLAQSLMKLVENAKAAGEPLKLKVFISGRNRLEMEGAQVFAEFFKAVGTLEEVAMPQNGIFHKGIAALALAFSVNSNLRIINLNDNTFTPKGARVMAEKLHHMQNLEVINFGDCLIKTAGAKYIAHALASDHKKLKELYLDSNEIGPEGGLAIATAMTNKEELTVLNLDYNQFVVSPMFLKQCTAAEFYKQSTGGRLLGLGNSGPSQLVEEARRMGNGSDEDFIFYCFGMFMRAASMATANNEEVQEAVKNTTGHLAKAIFTIAQNGDMSSIATNNLLVHLGLIKCEDKDFMLAWDLQGCLMILTNLVALPLFPAQTKSALQLFLSRPNFRIDACSKEKHMLMRALFQ